MPTGRRILLLQDGPDYPKRTNDGAIRGGGAWFGGFGGLEGLTGFLVGWRLQWWVGLVLVQSCPDPPNDRIDQGHVL